MLHDTIKENNREIDETRIPKEEKMARVIELLDNCSKDDFADRCGYVYGDFEFEEIKKEGKNGNKVYELKKEEDEETSKNNSRALKESHKLEKEEWNEMCDLLKDMKSWWD